MTSRHRRAAASRRLLALIAALPLSLSAQSTLFWMGVDDDWNNGGNWLAYVGTSGVPTDNDVAFVTDGGHARVTDSATAKYLNIGYHGSSNAVTVDTGGTLTIGMDLAVGFSDALGTFTVQGGGTGSSNSVLIYADSNFTITGSGSMWSTTSSINTTGAGAALYVQNGATLSVGDRLRLGASGNDSLTIDSGGVVTVTNYSELGYNVDFTSTATVSGTGSQWNTGDLKVGTYGQGTLTVGAGGVVNTGNALIANSNIGDAGANVGTVLVTGTGSQWKLTGDLGIGGYFDETLYNSGSLTVSDGGLVEVGTGGTGTVTIDTNGSVTLGSDLSTLPENVGPAGTLNASAVNLISSFGLGGPSATAASLIFNHSDDVTFTVPINGDGQVIKAGDGTLTLGGNNTYNGTTTVNGGVLSLGHPSALGVSALVINDGEARVTASGDFTLANAISGAGAFTHAGSGALTLGSVNTYTGATSVTGGGILILAAAGATGDSQEFNVNNTSTLRLESGVTLPIETLIVESASAIEVSGILSQVPGAYGADITDSTLHVLSGGYVEGSVDYSAAGYYFYGNGKLKLDTADAIDDTASFSFEENATLESSTPGAIAAGAFRFVGTDPLSIDPARTITLPGPGVITGGFFQLEGKIATDLAQTGMITGPVDLDLYDSAVVTVSAPGAIDGTAVTVDGDEGVIIGLDDEAVLSIETDNALVQTSLGLGGDSRFILNGHDVAIENLGADGGMIVNNSPTPATLSINPCGCGPTIVFANLFADASPGYVGTAGALSLDIDGNGDTILLGIQRHTGPTTVAGVTFAVYGDEDTDLVIRGLASSPLTLRDGGTLAGNGPVNTVTVQDGGGFSPGHAMLGPVNLLETGNVTLSGDTFLNLDLLDTAGAAASGWDLLVVNGTFAFSAIPGDTFTVFLRSGDEGATALLMGNFDPNASYSFTVLQATGGIIGFDTGLAFVDTSGFANSFDGIWSLRSSGDNQYLLLDYTAIPEPSAIAALGAAAAFAAVAVRRRRRAA